MDMNEVTRAQLEWDALLKAIADLTQSEMGRQRVMQLPFLRSAQAMNERMQLTEEAAAYVGRVGKPDIIELIDVSDELRATEQSVVISGEGLLNVAHTAKAISTMARQSLLAEPWPKLHMQLSLLPEVRPVAQHIEQMIGPDGKVRDSATPALFRLRQQALTLHEEMMRSLEQMALELEARGILSDRFVSIRSDRFVLPVKASERWQMKGIYHDSSNSGQTLFVEPESMVDQGNDLKLIYARIEDEERRILTELSRYVAEQAMTLKVAMGLMADLDVLFACAEFATRLHAVRPHIGHDAQEAPGAFSLRQARHPLLMLRASSVIANDIGFTLHERGLILTGPNTGGKTAALKTLGILTLMVHAGLLIPAHHSSRVPVLSGLYAVIGDQQSMTHALSTFAAHIKAIGEVLSLPQSPARPTLTLIDEICADTDPEAGSALANAILESLATDHSYVAVTTHYRVVAELSLQNPRFTTAAFEFDLKTLRPTYRLTRGAVGSSHPLEIAAYLGIPKEVIARAQGQVHTHRDTRVQDKLETLQAEQDKLREESERARVLSAELNQEKSALAQERMKLSALIKESELTLQHRMTREVKALEEKIKEATRLLQSGQAMAQAGTARAAMQTIQASREIVQSVKKTTRETLAPREVEMAATVQLGDRVLAQGFPPGKLGEVLSLDEEKGEAIVAFGALKAKLALSALKVASKEERRVAHRDEKEARQSRLLAARLADSKMPAGEYESRMRSARTLDVRGDRVEEALLKLERLLDIAICEERSEIQVLHGHGTGALKSAVREYLAISPYVKAYRPGRDADGNDSVTFVQL